MYAILFFSSRRRHTRWPRDWSSDVCSSDLSLEVYEANWTPSFPAEFERRRGYDPLPSLYLLEVAGTGAEEFQIGRASCRERVRISDGIGYLYKMRHMNVKK